MIRIRTFLVLAAALAGATGDAAAQPAGAFDVPMGKWEYRWLTRRDSTGEVTRVPAGGVLQLGDNGWHSHTREVGGTFIRSMGTYQREGNILYLPHTDMDHSGRMAVDTFGVRRIGDRIFLWQQVGEATQEYTLAPEGAPAEPAAVPGLIPSIHGFVQSVMFFESDGGLMPRPQRRYASAFAADSVRYMNVQIDLSHPIALADETVAVACTFENVELGASSVMEWTSEVLRGNASSGVSLGWGAVEPGAWPPGTYRVRCTVHGVAAPEASFTIR